jgi:hypothetical protein
MSKVLIGEVTREAGELAARHNLLKLVDYRRVLWAAGIVAPVAVMWLLFFSLNPALAEILLERQALMNVEIPRTIHLKNVTQDVWPTGAEVTVRFVVSGRYDPAQVGVLRIVPSWCRLTDDTFAELRRDKVPDAVVEKIKPLKSWYKYTDKVLSELQTRDVPPLVLMKLGRLKGEKAIPHDLFASEVAKVLSATEKEQFEEIILESSVLKDFELSRGDLIKELARVLDPIAKDFPAEKLSEFKSRILDRAIVRGSQTEEYYDLVYESDLSGEDGATYICKIPPSSRDFSIHARLGNGRTKEPSWVMFEVPPQLAPDNDQNPPLTAIQVLPTYLGFAPDGTPYTRRTDSSNRGEIVDALPQSQVIVSARFNKPIAKSRLIVIERVDGLKEKDVRTLEPFEESPDRKTASWGFATSPKTIAYRIELVDDRSFTNPIPIRRNIRMWEDRPPFVEFKKESTRNPDPEDPKGQPPASDYIWDMALSPNGRVMVIYQARSDLGIREANIRYRVIPKGVQMDLYPEWYKEIHHPREDKQFQVYFRQELIPLKKPDLKKLGEFVPDLGLFRYSLRGVSELDQAKMDVGFYAFPSLNPAKEPGELEAGGRRNFEVSDLKKMMPDGKFAKLDVGDTVELYIEVFDKLPVYNGKPRPAGYSREAKRKIVMSESDVALAILQRDEEKQKRTDKLRELTEDQIAVYKEKKK